MSLRIGSLCSGYGGLDLAVMDAIGGEVAWHAQYDPADKNQWAARILEHHWPGVPNHGDITVCDWNAVEPVDVLVGGFPCQDVSLAGLGAGLGPGTRSGIWAHFARAVRVLRPSLVVIENVRSLTSAKAHSDMERCPWCLGDVGDEPPLRALGAVLGDLADLGFDAEWICLPASDVGAPHQRQRVFVLAWPSDAELPVSNVAADTGHGHVGQRTRQARRQAGQRSTEREFSGLDQPLAVADADRVGQERGGKSRRRGRGSADDRQPVEWGPYAAAVHRWEDVMGRPAPAPTEPGRNGPRLSPALSEWMMGLPQGWVTGVPGVPRDAQLHAIGNGVVRQQGAAAIRILMQRRMSGGV